MGKDSILETGKYQIKIKNNSGDKVYDLNLFRNKDERVSVTSKMVECSLDEFIQLSTESAINICQVHVVAFHDYGKYAQKQLYCKIKQVSINGEYKEKEDIDFCIDPYQQQCHTVSRGVDFNIQLDIKNLILGYLLPDMEMTITFFIKQVSK